MLVLIYYYIVVHDKKACDYQTIRGAVERARQ